MNVVLWCLKVAFFSCSVWFSFSLVVFHQSWTHNIPKEKEFLRKLVKANVITDLTNGIWVYTHPQSPSAVSKTKKSWKQEMDWLGGENLWIPPGSTKGFNVLRKESCNNVRGLSEGDALNVPSEPKTPASCDGGANVHREGPPGPVPTTVALLLRSPPQVSRRTHGGAEGRRPARWSREGGRWGKSSAKHTSHREEVVLSRQRLNVFIFLSVYIRDLTVLVTSFCPLSHQVSLFVRSKSKLYDTCSTDWYDYKCSERRNLWLNKKINVGTNKKNLYSTKQYRTGLH